MGKLTMAAVVFATVFAFYVAGLSPTITSDDSGELAGVCATLGIAHSPGYPLYSLVGKTAQDLFPFANRAYRANLVSAMPAAAAAGIAFLFFLNISGSAAGAFFAAVAAGVSPFFYDTATGTEVYGLAIFFSSAMLAAVSSRLEAGRKYRLAFFLFGLAAVSHYLAAMWLPALLYCAAKERRFAVGEAAALAFFAVCGASAVAFIPVRAAAAPVYSWEDPKTFERFLQVILRERYGALNLAQGRMTVFDFSLWPAKIGFLFSALKENFSLAGVAAGAAGMWLSFRGTKSAGGGRIVAGNRAALLLLFAGSGPAFLFLANVGIDEVSSALLKRFFYLLAVSWGAYAALALARLKNPAIAAGAGVLLVAAAGMPSVGNSARGHFTFRDYAANILKNAPEGSLLIFDRADEMEFCVSYLLRVEGKRPDLRFLDANAGVSKSIYGDDYYKIWGARRLARRNAVESEIIAKSTGPVFYATFLPGQTAAPKKKYGLLERAANYEAAATFSDEVFVLRPPLGEIRSRGLYLSNFLLLGDYYLEAGDAARAEKNLGAAFGLGSSLAYHKLGYYYYKKGAGAKAAEVFGKIAGAYPDDADALLNLGVIAEETGDLREAEKFYLGAAAAATDSARARHNLGTLYWKLSRWREAAEHFAEAARMDPSNADDAAFAREAAKRAGK